MTTKVLTASEIKRKYTNEWVLLAHPNTDRLGRIVKGQVICHSQKRDSVDDVLLTTKIKNVAIYYAGDVVKDIIL